MKSTQFLSLLVLTGALIGSVVFAQQATKVNSKAAFLKKSPNTHEEPLPKGTQGNWWNAGISCAEYYIGAQSGTTNAEYAVYKYTENGPGEVVTTQALTLTETQGQYESLFIPWQPALDELYLAEYSVTYSADDGSVEEGFDSGVYTLNCLP